MHILYGSSAQVNKKKAVLCSARNIDFFSLLRMSKPSTMQKQCKMVCWALPLAALFFVKYGKSGNEVVMK